MAKSQGILMGKMTEQNQRKELSSVSHWALLASLEAHKLSMPKHASKVTSIIRS
ncbi:hypothetical protein QG37_05798 [Candidozyma auris]|nr:hypothetical protein QG37_05798 [[Candida] auris]